MKIYCDSNHVLRWARQWPEEPPVMASIYADELANQRYLREFSYAVKYSLAISNPDEVKAFMCKQPGGNNIIGRIPGSTIILAPDHLHDLPDMPVHFHDGKVKIVIQQ